MNPIRGNMNPISLTPETCLLIGAWAIQHSTMDGADRIGRELIMTVLIWLDNGQEVLSRQAAQMAWHLYDPEDHPHTVLTGVKVNHGPAMPQFFQVDRAEDLPSMPVGSMAMLLDGRVMVCHGETSWEPIGVVGAHWRRRGTSRVHTD